MDGELGTAALTCASLVVLAMVAMRAEVDSEEIVLMHTPPWRRQGSMRPGAAGHRTHMESILPGRCNRGRGAWAPHQGQKPRQGSKPG